MANVYIVLPCLQVSATVRRFLPGSVALKKKLQNDVSRGTFGIDANPYKILECSKCVWLQNKSKEATLLVDGYCQWFTVIGITKNFCKSYHAAYSNLE